MSANLSDLPSRLLPDIETAEWREILAEQRIRETLPRVWACSEFVATACLRAPGLLRELSASGPLFERVADDAFAREVRERVNGTNEAEVLEALRRFRKRHMVRIAWRDIAGWSEQDIFAHDG